MTDALSSDVRCSHGASATPLPGQTIGQSLELAAFWVGQCELSCLQAASYWETAAVLPA